MFGLAAVAAGYLAQARVFGLAAVAAGYLAQARVLGLAAIAAFFTGHILADYAWDTTLSAVVGGGRRWVTDRALPEINLSLPLGKPGLN